MRGHDRVVLRSLIRLMLVCLMVDVAHPFGDGRAPANVSAASTTRTTPYLQNGGFELVTGGVPNNWTFLQSRVNLGVTSLGGCPTAESMVDYDAIWTRRTDARNIISIAAGGAHGLALTKTGDVIG